MKQVLSKSFLILILPLVFLSSCVSIKKFRALEENQTKVENTLLATKQELSKTKLELNKFKDSSSSNSEEQNDAISDLKAKLKQSQSELVAAKASSLKYEQDLSQLKKQCEKNNRSAKKQLAPFLDIQKNLTTQHNSLKSIKQDLENLLVENPNIKMTISLNKDELTLSFEDDYLFLPNRSLTPQGWTAMFTLSDVLKKYPTIYIDANGHVSSGGDKKTNWKNGTRKGLSIIYALTHKEVLPDRMRVISYGEYSPIASNDTKEGKIKNNRTEIVLHYQNMKLLKLIPLKNEN